MTEADRLFARIMHRVLRPLPPKLQLRRPSPKRDKTKPKRKRR